MLHILFSILISLGVFSGTVTKVEPGVKKNLDKKEIIWADSDDDWGGF